MKNRIIPSAILWIACLAILGPDLAVARQNSHQFNQSWLILGPYYRDNTGAAPGHAALRSDHLTNGVVSEKNILPTTGMVVNTNYRLPACLSYSFVVQCRANGKFFPTVFQYNVPGDGALVDFVGSDSTIPPNCVFDQGRTYDPFTNPQGNNRLNHTLTYAFAYANNLSGAPLTVWLGMDCDDSIQVLVNGVERYVSNRTGEVNADPNYAALVSAPFILRLGRNLVCVKVFNGSGGCGFRMRFQNSAASGVNAGAGIPPATVRWETDKGSYVYPPLWRPDAAFAYRTLRPLPYTSGAALRADILVTTAAGRPSPTVYEFPPADWTIAPPLVSMGSATLATTTTGSGYTGPLVKWQVGRMDESTTNAATLTYRMTPPPSATGDAVCTGTVVSDQRRLIAHDVYAFAPRAPVGLFEWPGDLGSFPIGEERDGLRGNPRFTGATSLTGGVYTVTGAGSDLGGAYDRGRAVVARVSGPFILRGDVRWTSVSSNRDCKAVLAVRSALSPGAVEFATGLRNYFNPNWSDPDRFTRTQRSWVALWREVPWAEAAVGSVAEVTTQSGATIVPSRFMLVKRGRWVDSFAMVNGRWTRHPDSPRG